MAKVSQYPEFTLQVPTGSWLFAAIPTGELDSEGNPEYKTWKVDPENVGAQGPIGPQGPAGSAGPAGADGAAGANGANGANGTNGTNGANADMTRSSTDSVAVGLGAKSFNYTVSSTNLGWAIGTRLRAASAGTPANYVEGLVTAVSSTAVTINSDNFGGAGSSADWNIGIAGDVGATGATGATGAAGAAGADGADAATIFRTTDIFAIDTIDDYSAGAISTLDQGFGWTQNGSVLGGASSIVSRTVSGISHKRLSLITGSIVRPMPWLGNWNRLQIIMALRINHGSTFTGSFGWGICSGTTNHFNTTTVDNFIGMYESTGANDFVFTAGSRINYFNSNPAIRYCTRRVNTTTDRSSGSGTAGGAFASSEDTMSFWCYEISRGSTGSVTYSLGHMSSSSTNVNFFNAKSIFERLIMSSESSTVGNQPSWPVLTGSGTNTTSHTFDETTGALDTLNIYWSHGHALEIAAYGVRKVY